jgi:hypothetical protein
MESPELAREYVKFDRFVFFQLQSSSAFQNRCAVVTRLLTENHGLEDFKKLCNAGAERDELRC